MNQTAHPKTALQRPLILAHRGLVTMHQENSLAAIMAALEHPDCDGVEFDVFLTEDDQVVVFHDENLLRLTGCDQSIYDTDWPTLQRLCLQKTVDVDNGHQRQYAQEQPIPLLRTVLQAIKGKTSKKGRPFFVDIELKAYSPNPLRYAVGQAAASIVRELGMAQQCVLSSFNYFMLIAAKNEYPDAHIACAYDTHMPLSNAQLNEALETDILSHVMNASAVIAEYTLLDNDSVSKLNGKDKRVGSYTFFPLGASDEVLAQQGAHLRMLAAQGLYWIETDDVAAAAKALE